MTLYYLSLCCFLHLLQSTKHFPSVLATNDSELVRHVMEDGFKPAIFGSYNYDPIRQVFDPPPRKENFSQWQGGKILSTAMGPEDTTVAGGEKHYFRNRAPLSNVSAKWWNQMPNLVSPKDDKKIEINKTL